MRRLSSYIFRFNFTESEKIELMNTFLDLHAKHMSEGWSSTYALNLASRELNITNMLGGDFLRKYRTQQELFNKEKISEETKKITLERQNEFKKKQSDFLNKFLPEETLVILPRGGVSGGG